MQLETTLFSFIVPVPILKACNMTPNNYNIDLGITIKKIKETVINQSTKRNLQISFVHLKLQYANRCYSNLLDAITKTRNVFF